MEATSTDTPVVSFDRAAVLMPQVGSDGAGRVCRRVAPAGRGQGLRNERQEIRLSGGHPDVIADEGASGGKRPSARFRTAFSAGTVFGPAFRVCEPNKVCLRTVEAVGTGAVLLQTARRTDRVWRPGEKGARVRQDAFLARCAVLKNLGQQLPAGPSRGRGLERFAFDRVHRIKKETQHNQRSACLGSPSN